MPREGNGLPSWDFVNMMHMKKRYEDFGFDLLVIESAPPMNRIKLDLPGRDEEIEIVKALLTNVGALHIPVWCYNFMAQIGWFRTSTTTRTRGGALSAWCRANIPGSRCARARWRPRPRGAV